MDNYYPIEIKICSKNGWSTPQEAAGIWATPYARTGITVHWWGDGTGADNHDNIVNYLAGQAAAGNISSNYVASDNKITLMVSPDNVAWASNAGNPTTISIEFQPTLGDEGYKKGGWLIEQLEERYGRTLQLFPHNHWTSTQCPGTIDLNRLRAEADKWKSGAYTTPPTPTQPPAPDPTPPTLVISHSVLPKPVLYTFNKDANLWNYASSTWDGFKAIKQYKKGDVFTVYAIADNHNVQAKYGVTEYSYTKGITNGVNMVDLDIVTTPEQPVPTPPPVQNPDPTPVPTPDPGTVIPPTGATGPTGSPDLPTGPTGAPTPTPEPQPTQADWRALAAALVAAVAAIVAALASILK